MRTTIELSDEHRARLLELAAERGTNLSDLVREAIERYLAPNAARRERAAAALGVLGSLGDEDADALEESFRRVRGSWR